MDFIAFVIHWWLPVGFFSTALIFLIVFAFAGDDFVLDLQQVASQLNNPSDINKIIFLTFILMCALGFVSAVMLIRMIMRSLSIPPNDDID